MNPVLSTLRYFRDEYSAHVDEKRCPAGVCKALITFSIIEERCTGCRACALKCPQDCISGEKREVHTIDPEDCASSAASAGTSAGSTPCWCTRRPSWTLNSSSTASRSPRRKGRASSPRRAPPAGTCPASATTTPCAPNASCRLCLVEIRRPGRDWTQLTTSCDYPVSAGLEVVTDSPRIRELRAHEPAVAAAARARRPRCCGGWPSSTASASRCSPPSTDAPLPDCILCELCVRVCSAAGLRRAGGRSAAARPRAWVRPSGWPRRRTAWAAAPAWRSARPTASRWWTPPRRARSGAAPSSSRPACAAAGRSRPGSTRPPWTRPGSCRRRMRASATSARSASTSERLAAPGR